MPSGLGLGGVCFLRTLEGLHEDEEHIVLDQQRQQGQQEGELGQTGQTQSDTAPPASAAGSHQPTRCCGFVPFDPEDATDITNPNIQRGHLANIMRRARS